MGLTASKEFSDLFIAENGSATSDDNLKKLKIVHVLASGISAPKNNANWKNLELANNNEQTVIINLKAGARFIQQGRVNKENVLIVTEQQNNDATAFLVAYFMLLSGLPVKCAKEAVSKLNDKVKVTSRFDKELEAIRNSSTPKLLREELLKTSGTYPPDLLAEDVKKIYRLANITPPSPEEIKLEDARRISLIESAWAKANQEKELAENVEKSKKHSISSPKESPSPGAKGSFLKRFSVDSKKESMPETKIKEDEAKIKEEKTKVSAEEKQVQNAKKEEPAHKNDEVKLSSPTKMEPLNTSPLKTDVNLTSPSKTDMNLTSPLKTDANLASPSKTDANLASPSKTDANLTSPSKTDANLTSPTKTNEEKSNKPLENGSVNDKTEAKKQSGHKVSITYALSTESTEADAVDEYLRTHSEEERQKTRRRVTITRALSKSVDE